MRRRVIGFLVASGGMAAALACSSGAGAGPDDDGPSSCANPVVFSALPVPIDAIRFATPLGVLSPPAHTLPTDHVYLYLNRMGVPLAAPGTMTVTHVTRTRYTTSPTRQGQTDYAIDADLCQGHRLRFGHVQTVPSNLAQQVPSSGCSSYTAGPEVIETCGSPEINVRFSAGQSLGTAGGASSAALDFGVYDTGHQNFFVNPARYHEFSRTAVCPYDFFTPEPRTALYGLVGDGVRPASGETPRCGAMSLDVAGTARGWWVLESNPVNQTGDESSFAALVPHPLFPESGQTFSFGPAPLHFSTGQGNTRYPVAASGRVNRRFSEVGQDNVIYCYVHDEATATSSYLVRLSPSNVLTVQRVNHPVRATPCSADPATWAFGAGAVNFIR